MSACAKKCRLIAGFALVTLFFVPVARADQPASGDAESALRDLWKRNRLCKKEDYKALRGIFAKRFETLYQEEIKRAFGGDLQDMTSWLNDNADIKEDFYTAIDEENDNIEGALKIFRDIYKAHPDKCKAYSNLAIATALVWDDIYMGQADYRTGKGRGVYDYRQHQVRCKCTLPSAGIGALENFAYFLEHESSMQGRAQLLPWEFLVYGVNHRTPVDEREWALKKYLKSRALIGRCYSDIKYDHDMLRGEVLGGSSNLRPRLAGQTYTLPSILEFGGVCAMQADFAARVGKSLGVPAEYVWGAGNSGGLHAWVMWVELKQVNKGKVAFSLESYGRYYMDQYYTGKLNDPQTGKEILDRDMELRLSIVGYDQQGKRHAALAMKAFPLLREKLSLDLSGQFAYLDQVMNLCPYNEDCWLTLAQLSKDGLIKRNNVSKVTYYGNKLVRTFRNFPDFTWKVLEDLLTAQTDLQQRSRLYEDLVRLYEGAGRPDLACQARLKLADYQVEAKKHKDAAKGLAFTIEKFPGEGRYVPQLMDKLEQACEGFKDGNKLLQQFYLNVLPRIPGKRGDEPSKYCIAMHEKAIKFFKNGNKEKIAGDLERRLKLVKAGEIR